MHQYPWISLEILENIWINSSMPEPWISLIIFYVRQAFEDALRSKYAWVLNMARLLYMQGLNRVLNMSEYGSICPYNVWIHLNMPYCPSVSLNVGEYCWMFLNMSENAWINCSDYARILNMPSQHLRYLTRFWICLGH